MPGEWMHICVIVFVCVCVFYLMYSVQLHREVQLWADRSPVGWLHQHQNVRKTISPQIQLTLRFPPATCGQLSSHFTHLLTRQTYGPGFWCVCAHMFASLFAVLEIHTLRVLFLTFKDNWIAEDCEIPHIQLAILQKRALLIGLSQLPFSFDKTRKLQDEEDEIRKPLRA